MATPAQMPPKRREWPVTPPGDAYPDHETERMIAVAYRRELIEKRGCSWATAEVVLRSVVWMRDGGRCRYCGCLVDLKQTSTRMTFDHVQPISRGGGHSYDNIWSSCRRCNCLKGDMTLAEFDAWLLGEASALEEE